MPLRICFVTSEATPYAKTGGLADVSGALLKYLHADGHDIRLFMPAYASIARARFGLQAVDGLQNLSLQLGSHSYQFSVLTPSEPGAREVVYLIDCPACYDRPALYTTDPDEHRRFLVLTHAAFLCCQRLRFAPQIMHFNDWHSAAGTLLKRTVYAWDALFHGARTVLTVHNIGYQGVIGAAALPELLPSGEAYLLDQDALAGGHINLLGTGLSYADLITTVSPTYAREIQSAEYGMGLEQLLRRRSADVIGILNGVDYDQWDPRHDRFLPQHFDASNLVVKLDLKRQLLRRLGLNSVARTALIGIVSRLATQKGFDLLFDALPRLMAARDFNLVALGSGEPRYEAFFARLQQLFPTRVHFRGGYDEELAHWIEGGQRHVPDALALRALRTEPDVQPALRHRTGGTAHRRSGRFDSALRCCQRPGHRYRIQRLRRRGGHVGHRHRAGSVSRQHGLASAGAQRHGAGFLLEPAGAPLR